MTLSQNRVNPSLGAVSSRGDDPLLLDEQAWDRWLERETDIPASPPTVPLPVHAAGIAELRLPLSLAGLASQSHASITVTLDLSPARRGVHMSRLVEASLGEVDRVWLHPAGAAAHILQAALEGQPATSGQVELQADGFITSTAQQSGLASLEPVVLFGNARGRLNDFATAQGLEVQALSACPCTQAYTRWTLARELTDLDSSAAMRLAPGLLTATHVQRLRLRTMLQDASPAVTPTQLLESVRRAVTIARTTLKRPDEHELVRSAHRRPQFTEDAVRDVAAQIVVDQPSLEAEARLTVTARAEESIHPHEAVAEIDLSVGDVRQALRR